MADDKNIRPVIQVMGKDGPFAQGAEGEALVSLKFCELDFSLSAVLTSVPSITVGSMPNLTIASVPSLTVGTMPNLTIASLPSLTIGSIPSLTVGSMPTLSANSTKGVGRAGGGTIATTAGTIYTATEARRNGKLIIAPVISEGQVINVWHVPSGGARGDGYLIGRYVLAADATPVEITGIGWASGDMFDAELPTGTTGKCTLTVYGETY